MLSGVTFKYLKTVATCILLQMQIATFGCTTGASTGRRTLEHACAQAGRTSRATSECCTSLNNSCKISWQQHAGQARCVDKASAQVCLIRQCACTNVRTLVQQLQVQQHCIDVHGWLNVRLMSPDGMLLPPSRPNYIQPACAGQALTARCSQPAAAVNSMLLYEVQ